MKNVLVLSAIFSMIGLSSIANAQDQQMELEEVCYGDIDLGEYIVQVIDIGSSSSEVMSEGEISQIAAILADESVAVLSVSEKVQAVLKACAEGRILQERHTTIINLEQPRN